MLFFLTRRLLQGIAVILAVAFLSFVLFRFMGDPVRSMVAEDATLEEQQDIRERLGLNDSIVVQFTRYVSNAAVGNMGLSYRSGQPVVGMILERLPATIELVVAAMIIALGIGIPLGIWSAIHPESRWAQLFQVLSLVGISIPTFVIGILLILFFAVILGWLPSFGRGQVTRIGFWETGLLTQGGWRAIILPAFTLGIYQLALFMRLVRSGMMEVIRQDFIRFARARGLPSRLILFRHALKNTLMPLVTIAGMQFGSLIAFAIVTETVFQWPGIGYLFLQAIQFLDIPLMATYLMFIGCIFVMINILVDILYFIIDPRLRKR